MPRTGKHAATGSAGLGARSLRRWLVQAGLPLLAGAGLLGGVLLLGGRALEALRPSARYRAAFADIACIPPPGMDREAFLGEVQYLGNLPDQLDLLDETLPNRLGAAFAAHPWVARVQHVDLTANSDVSVHLSYRQAVLVVCLPATRATTPCRAVDRVGVLLPIASEERRLPRLVGTVAAPTGRPGQPWGDARVEAAARTVGLLVDRLPLESCTLEVGLEGVVLNAPHWRIVWGSPPGSEKPGEPQASVKLQRLADQPGDLNGFAYDLRPAAAVLRTPLAEKSWWKG